uniref:Myotubularin phosphatase domain-containing protein n=1 Tax=Macrostomum lignano TaxID=282301 RepID=A0A1I8GT69_9PLAT
ELLERIRSARHPGSVREIFALSADGGRLVGDLDDEFADTPLPVTASAAAAALPTTAMEASATGTGAGSSGGVKIKKPKKLHSKPYTLTRRLAKQTTSAAHAAANKLMTLRPGAAGVSSHRQHQQEHQWRSSLRPPPSPAAPGSAAIPGHRSPVLRLQRRYQPAPPALRPTSELLRDTLETPGYEDLHRLGLLGKQLTDAICLRICCANFEHDLVSSYPAVLIVPRAVTDKSLRRLTKAHRQCRFPVVVWRCHSNGALLFRSGSFQGKSLAWAGGLGSVGGGTTAAADGAEVGRFSEEQVRPCWLFEDTDTGRHQDRHEHRQADRQ